MITYDDSHPGTLIVDLKDDIEVKVAGVPSLEADRILEQIANRRCVKLQGPLTGIKYVIEGYESRLARWEPDH